MTSCARRILHVDVARSRASRRASRAAPPSRPTPTRSSSSQSADPKPKTDTTLSPGTARVTTSTCSSLEDLGVDRGSDRGAAARAVSGGARGGADASRAAAACGGSSRRDQTRRADSKVAGAAASGGSARPWKSANSVLPTPADRFDQRGIPVVDEVGERLRLSVLLAHEEQRHEGREERGGRREPDAIRVDDRRQAITERPVPDLIVVLGAHDEVPARRARRPSGRTDARGTPSNGRRRRIPRGTRWRDPPPCRSRRSSGRALP